MAIENNSTSRPSPRLVGRRFHWLAGALYVAVGLFVVADAAAHGDSRMFARPAHQDGVPVPATAYEVTLPDQVRGQASHLFRLSPVVSAPASPVLRTFGAVVASSDAVIDVNTIVSGQVDELYVRVGDHVRKGQPIASIFNPEFITTQKGYLEFLKNEAKLQILREEGRLPDYLKDAKENLRWWGMTDPEIADLIDHGRVVQHIVLNAPTDGVVTDLFVQPGSLVNPGDRTMKQFVVVGKAIARMVATGGARRIEAYLYPDQQGLLRPGLTAVVKLPDGRQVERAVSQVLPVIDAATQRARFLIDLKDGDKAAIGETVDVGVRLDRRPGTWVPRDAVLAQAISPVAFVNTASGKYLRKPVRVLGESGELLQVTGLGAGERVVVTGKMMLEGVYRMSAAPHDDDHHHHDD